MASILNSMSYLRVATPLARSKKGKKVTGIERLVHRCIRYIPEDLRLESLGAPLQGLADSRR